MEDLWTMFCGDFTCSYSEGKLCHSIFWHFTHPSSCINQGTITCFNIVLLIMLLFNMIQKPLRKPVAVPARFRNYSALQMASAIVSGCLGMVYLCLSIWILIEKLRKTQTILPMNWGYGYEDEAACTEQVTQFATAGCFSKLSFWWLNPLMKKVTVSSGPLLLNAFILVAEGKGNFEYEAIHKKQLRLSNAARLMHSSGEITNYVTVEAYRIGEFPFWFYQTWTTSLQLCIALVILFQAVRLAMIAALVAIILTVLCNTPLAKLQHRFQSKLMGAQDERLKASSEALINMKVLKLYAWENHFKKVIENLRAEEYKWLSAVQLRKAYNSFLFLSSPVLDPVRSIPDVIGIVIQAKVAFERVGKFLEAPELQNANVRQRCLMENDLSISIKSREFSWEENS
ncbi:ABC transporter C family member 10-like [Gossypium australe]|uniref:ABC transporter C family member 10-like n=1 Tax=Gossypium australe TaxID=47621 RepID=A0A5B6W2V8_9ROSI|nr:ABC transporter C family member 10-like [Gossypium australe]